MIKIVLFMVAIGIIIYYVNSYFAESWILRTIYSMPKMVGLLIALVAIMFPRDYDKLPDMIYSVYNSK